MDIVTTVSNLGYRPRYQDASVASAFASFQQHAQQPQILKTFLATVNRRQRQMLVGLPWQSKMGKVEDGPLLGIGYRLQQILYSRVPYSHWFTCFEATPLK